MSFERKINIKNLVSTILYYDFNKNYENTILLTGSGRSGTTWVSEIINYKNDYRYMFEPFNPMRVNLISDFSNKQYLRPELNDNDKLEKIKKVLRGDVRNLWVDHYNKRIIVHKRLIKDIRANMMIKYIKNNFPKLPIIFLVRNPFAVALSMQRLGWGYHFDEYYSQPDLMKNHLNKFEGIIKNTKGIFEKYILRWCIDNYVPLNEVEKDDIRIVFYENLCMSPKKEVLKIFEFLNCKFEDTKINKTINRPSKTSTSKSAIYNNKDLINSWKNNITANQYKNSKEILKEFGFLELYDDDGMPNANKLPIL